MKLLLKTSLRSIKIITFLTLFILIFFYFILIDGRYKTEVLNLRKLVINRDDFINELALPKIINYPVQQNYERKDWNDWDFIHYEKTRKGDGEQGEKFVLTDPKEIKLNEKLFKIEGLYVVASDKISVNRSVPDTRLEM